MLDYNVPGDGYGLYTSPGEENGRVPLPVSYVPDCPECGASLPTGHVTSFITPEGKIRAKKLGLCAGDLSVCPYCMSPLLMMRDGKFRTFDTEHMLNKGVIHPAHCQAIREEREAILRNRRLFPRRSKPARPIKPLPVFPYHPDGTFGPDEARLFPEMLSEWLTRRPEMVLGRASIPWLPEEPTDEQRVRSVAMALLRLEKIFENLPTIPMVLWKQSLFDAACDGRESFAGRSYREYVDRASPQWWVWTAQYKELQEIDSDRFVKVPSYCAGFVIIPSKFDDQKTGSVLNGLATAHIFIPLAQSSDKEDDRCPRVVVHSPICEDELVRESDAFIPACMEFMRLPIAAKEPAPEPRQLRRAREREGKRPAPEVTVVTLRKLAHKSAEDDGGEKHHIDYSCHFLVRSHWRQQFYRSTGERKPRYIQSFVKGDPSKPFKPPSRKLFVVAR
jgi:hypothetical protein